MDILDVIYIAFLTLVVIYNARRIDRIEDKLKNK